jgi:hypothetical protein
VKSHDQVVERRPPYPTLRTIDAQGSRRVVLRTRDSRGERWTWQLQAELARIVSRGTASREFAELDRDEQRRRERVYKWWARQEPGLKRGGNLEAAGWQAETGGRIRPCFAEMEEMFAQ